MPPDCRQKGFGMLHSETLLAVEEEITIISSIIHIIRRTGFVCCIFNSFRFNNFLNRCYYRLQHKSVMVCWCMKRMCGINKYMPCTHSLNETFS